MNLQVGLPWGTVEHIQGSLWLPQWFPAANGYYWAQKAPTHPLIHPCTHLPGHPPAPTDINHACTRKGLHTCMHAYVCTDVQKYKHEYTGRYVHTYMHACIHAYIRTYIHTCMHTYMHTYIFWLSRFWGVEFKQNAAHWLAPS